MKEDKTLTCCECGNEFVFTASEQEFPAVCAECGKETMVPFKPSDRPVYCRECFNARKH